MIILCHISSRQLKATPRSAKFQIDCETYLANTWQQKYHVLFYILNQLLNMMETKKRITVFGGSRRTAEADEYREGLKLGRLLVEAGFDVCSGGYARIMEA